MVVLRNIKSQFYTDLGFCTKTQAMDFLKQNNKTGRHFKNQAELKEYLINEKNKDTIKAAEKIKGNLLNKKRNMQNMLLKITGLEIKVYVFFCQKNNLLIKIKYCLI